MSPTQSLLERATSLSVRLSERAAATEHARRLPEATLRDFTDAGFFSLLSPARWGGLEWGPEVLARVLIQLGRGCGSSAWLLGLVSMNHWLMGRAPESLQRQLFTGSEPLCLAATFGAELGQAREAEGGYVVSGRWRYLTGILHANQVAVTARVVTAAGQPTPETRLLVLPAAALTVEDTWRAVGLRATGSHDVRAEQVFVPASHAPRRELLFGAPAADAPLPPGSLYRLPLLALFACVAAAPALGIARGAVEAYGAGLPGFLRRQGEIRPAALLRLADSSVELDAAEALLLRTLEELSRDNALPEGVSMSTRARARLGACHVVELCKRAVQRVLDAGGTRAHQEDSPLARAQRDLQVLSSHVAFDHDAAAQLHGHVLLGFPLPEGSV